MSLPVFVDLTAGVDNRKIRLTKVIQLLLTGRTDEHVGHEVLLPGHLVHESNLPPRFGRGATEAIEHVRLVLGVEVRHRLVVELLKDLGAGGLVDVVPIDVLLGLAALVQDQPLVLGTAACEFAGVDGEGVPVFRAGDPSLFVGHFVLEEFLVGQVLVDGRHLRDTKGVNANLGACIRACVGGGDVVLVSFERGAGLGHSRLIGLLEGDRVGLEYC
mmetsp:Transcript_13746/g.25800  ORF Transcript_13746/g.25800 Transcript_13746/m.25800 type:complete len:216 (+) Transcript_13746:775-1422(+)